MPFYKNVQFQTVSASFLLVVAIGMTANAIDSAQLNKQTDLALAETPVVLATEGPTRLEVKSEGTGGELQFGSQEEVYRFSIDATGPYTLRYISFNVEHAGLKDLENPANWTLFPVKKGVIEYQNPIGKGERWENGIVQLRLNSKEADGYLGEPGSQEFVLTADVLSNGLEGPWIKIHLNNDLPYSFDWMWTSEHFFGSWLRFDGTTGSELLDGLPTGPLEWK